MASQEWSGSSDLNTLEDHVGKGLEVITSFVENLPEHLGDFTPPEALERIPELLQLGIANPKRLAREMRKLVDQLDELLTEIEE